MARKLSRYRVRIVIIQALIICLAQGRSHKREFVRHIFPRGELLAHIILNAHGRIEQHHGFHIMAVLCAGDGGDKTALAFAEEEKIVGVTKILLLDPVDDGVQLVLLHEY